ncbi:hypothetical protein EYV94_09025 [Puteibacter caeruleilacunae]|nr:hypothetical protein EYV94_09025 [Puteibacter caeruleilacunae]
MKKIVNFLISPWLMGMLFVILSVAMAAATFIEHSNGTPIAREVVYNAHWFEFLFLLLCINIIGRIIQQKLYRLAKLPIFLFHFAFILMVLGAGITRYFGFEGTMHIREGEASDYCLSTEKYLNFNIISATGDTLINKYSSFNYNKRDIDEYSESEETKAGKFTLDFVRVHWNATEQIADVATGNPIIELILLDGMRGHSRLFIEGDRPFFLQGRTFAINNPLTDIQFKVEQDGFYISSLDELSVFSMRSREASLLSPGEEVKVEPTFLYDLGGLRFMVRRTAAAGMIRPMMVNPHEQETGVNALEFQLTHAGQKYPVYIWDNHQSELPVQQVEIGENLATVSWNPKEIRFPFDIQLNDFILERYPGSNSPSSYKSDVTLLDEKNNVNKTYLIYMNNILKYQGYRFYQSSYDQDELGTVLSVNRDPWGMGITYAGYFLMIICIILSIFAKKSLLRTATANMWRKSSKIIILALILGATATAASAAEPMKVPTKQANDFGRLLIQDQRGRTKPLYSASHDVLRKIAKKHRFNGHSPMQVVLGFYFDFDHWKDVPLIKVGHSQLANMLGINDEYASYADLLNDDEQGNYKLGQQVEDIYSRPPADRNKFDKEIMKVNERFNILYMIASGSFFKVFPLEEKDKAWAVQKEATFFAPTQKDSLYTANIMQLYRGALLEGEQSGNYKKADEYLASLIKYQQTKAHYELPSKTKINAEIFYLKSGLFEKLFPYYSLMGFILLILLLSEIISGKVLSRKLKGGVKALLAIGFVAHTVGLGLRWYISGHAPMSNGYETMLFVSWVTVLAGFLFSKRAELTLAATSILGSLTLMVAHLSFMDPQITNLVPVLKSYWLTFHVSVITGSYGFLGLGSILGIIIMVLHVAKNKNNFDRIESTIDELTVINFKALTLGLYLLTIGTFLGAIWANESWGRYWGWDPKETWSLITIAVYSFVVHSMKIPGFQSRFAFNSMSLFAISSVLMTFFGVNYFLSGLHSYAGGEASSVPMYVYAVFAALVVLTGFAYKKRVNGERVKG